MIFNYTNAAEVSREIGKARKQEHISDIPVRFLKLCRGRISVHLSDLFNLCIDQSVYPDLFKLARITPIFKTGSKLEIKNHRPVSVLPNLAKLFESLIYSRIKHFFDDSEVLSENQFGFRKDQSTELACFQLVNKIVPAIDEKCFCICVFLDFSACFDTLSRQILFHKLDRYGVRGESLDFIRSYFSSRRQFVNFNGIDSATLYQNLGVIQGSKCGPLFFDIYSKDMNNLLKDDENILYADDTTLVYSHHDLDFLTNHVNNKLSLLYDWCCFNKLLLNPS